MHSKLYWYTFRSQTEETDPLAAKFTIDFKVDCAERFALVPTDGPVFEGTVFFVWVGIALNF